jgi:hypothetical protein
MIAGGRFYEIYLAVSRHFTADSYDYFKYNGKINVSKDSFTARKDKYFFEKMAAKCANEQMAIGLCVANTIASKKYIRNFTLEQYHEWLAYRDALDYRFIQELKKFKERKRGKNALETLMEMVIGKELSLEFLIIFNQVVEDNYVYNRLDEVNNFIWTSDIKERIKKYEPFVLNLWEIDEDKVENLRLVNRDMT